jgi:purine-nucleoside phosphorylase
MGWMSPTKRKGKKVKKESFSEAVESSLDAVLGPEVADAGKQTAGKAEGDTAVPVDQGGLGDQLQDETGILSEVEGTHRLVGGGKGDQNEVLSSYHGEKTTILSEMIPQYIDHSLTWKRVQKYLDDKAYEISRVISSSINFSVDLGIIFGSGLSALTERFSQRYEIPTADLDGWFKSPAAEEDERLVLGQLNGKGILIIPHRIHTYEGFNAAETTMPVRILRRLGARLLITTNAAGSISSKAPVGRLMVINDHISFLVDSPLRGLTDSHVSMRGAYNSDLIAQIHTISSHLNIRLGEGVYVALSGPEYETPAMATYLRRLGGDVVGMSTIPEVIMARYLGMKVLGISAVTNDAGSIFDHSDVLDEAEEMSQELDAVLAGLMASIRY